MQARKEHCIVFTGNNCAEWQELEVNPAPFAPDEVAGRTLATLISTGTELAGFQGLWAWGKYPHTPGYAAVFEIEEVGSEVKDLDVGDLVFCMGPHRSYQRLRRAEVLPVPTELSPETATFARMMGVTMTTLMTTVARPGDKVLITGLGLVGHLAAKNFAHCGYTVYGVDPSPVRRAIAQESGLENVLPTVPLDDPELAKKIALALECSGHEQALVDACNIIRKRGEVVQVASPWRQYTQLSAHELRQAIFRNYAVVRSGWEWEMPRHAADFRPHSIFGNLATALQWLAEGRVRVEGLYTAEHPSDAQQIYQQLLHGETEHLAVVLDWRSSDEW